MKHAIYRLHCLALCAAVSIGTLAAKEPSKKNAKETPTKEEKLIFPDQAPWIDAKPSEVPGVKHVIVRSKSMDRDVGVMVYLPPGYEKGTQRYPVVYFLHGGKSTESGGDYIFKPVDEMIRKGEIQPFIMVRPNGGRRSFYKDWPLRNVKSETWIIKELIPHIDANYRTLARKESRAIAGFSMGGIGALEFATRFPELFAVCATASGPSYEFMHTVMKARNPDGLFTKECAAGGLTPPEDGGLRGRAERFKGKVAFRFTAGGADSKNENYIRESVLETAALFKELGIPCESDLLDGVGHDFKAHFTPQHFDKGGGGMFRFVSKHISAEK